VLCCAVPCHLVDSVAEMKGRRKSNPISSQFPPNSCIASLLDSMDAPWWAFRATQTTILIKYYINKIHRDSQKKKKKNSTRYDTNFVTVKYNSELMILPISNYPKRLVLGWNNLSYIIYLSFLFSMKLQKFFYFSTIKYLYSLKAKTRSLVVREFSEVSYIFWLVKLSIYF